MHPFVFIPPISCGCSRRIHHYWHALLHAMTLKDRVSIGGKCCIQSTSAFSSLVSRENDDRRGGRSTANLSSNSRCQCPSSAIDHLHDNVAVMWVGAMVIQPFERNPPRVLMHQLIWMVFGLADTLSLLSFARTQCVEERKKEAGSGNNRKQLSCAFPRCLNCTDMR